MMINSLKYIGQWKLPESKQWQLTGELSFDIEKGIELNLLGSFAKNENEKEFNFPIIHGFTADGKKISLLSCSGWADTAIPGIMQSKFQAQYIVIGAWIFNTEDLKIETVAVHYSNLDEWVNVHGFEVEKKTRQKDDQYSAILKYTQPKLIPLFESTEKNVCLWFSAKSPWLGLNVNQNTISQKIFLNIKYAKLANFNYALNEITRFKDFFAFGLSRYVVPTEINLDFKNGGEETIRVNVVYKEQIYPKQIEDKIFDYTTLFSYEHIKDNASTVVGNWLIHYDKLHPVFDRFFDSFYNPSMSNSNHFLNIMFGIETYHRRTNDTTYFPDSHFKELKEALKAALPEGKENKVWFNMRFNYANEIPLKKRLQLLCDNFEKIIELFEPNIPEFIKKVADTRNYLVHYDEGLKNKSISEDDMPKYFLSLRIILELCILKEMGFSEEEMTKAVKRSQINWSKF